MRAVQHHEQRVEPMLDALLVLSEQHRSDQYPA